MGTTALLKAMENRISSAEHPLLGVQFIITMMSSLRTRGKSRNGMALTLSFIQMH
jgi:hypothetical protein